VQSLWNTKKRPTLIQVLFNIANLIVTVGACFLVARVWLPSGMEHYRPAVMALLAFVYFVVNTMLVSGVLALLEGKPLLEVSQDWYVWSFPYYLIGAALVGLVPIAGYSAPGEAWLILLPLAYLIHFFVGLMQSRPTTAEAKGKQELPGAARWYIAAVQVSGLALLLWSAFYWQSNDLLRFAAFLVLAVVTATLKVQLPGLYGNISLAFVIRLVAVAELGFTEAVLLSAVAGAVQSLWKSKHPSFTRTAFNASSLTLSTAIGYGLCRVVLNDPLSHSLTAFLIAATLILYLGNTVMVATVLCLVEQRPLRSIWQSCYFWSWPYYLVGAAAAGLMTATSHLAGWAISLLVLPAMGLVYISYRIHLSNQSAAWGS
jgi:hypothetical protein